MTRELIKEVPPADVSVSVVICCYNYQQYVGHAIESVLNQSQLPEEIIVVDDGSTDDSVKIIRSYLPKLRLIQKENAGHVSAVNSGFAESTGSIILFLDADDILHKNAIAKIKDAWTPKASKIQGELQIFDSRGNILPRFFCKYPNGYDSKAIQHDFQRYGSYLTPVLSGNAYTRHFLSCVMPLTIERAPDGILNGVAPLYGECVVVRDVIGFYRLHDSNQSTQGEGLSSIGARFRKRLQLRSSELKYITLMASKFGIQWPGQNLMDFDIIFLNYRLMLKKINENYDGCDADDVLSLLKKSIYLLWSKKMSPKTMLINHVWLFALAVAPSKLAFLLINYRFGRSGLFTRLGQR